MIGLVEIKPIEDSHVGTTLRIDGKQIRGCTGYTIEQQAGGIPTCELQMIVRNDYRNICDVHISNLEDIAMLLDDDSFQELCELYKAKKEGLNEDNSENDNV